MRRFQEPCSSRLYALKIHFPVSCNAAFAQVCYGLCLIDSPFERRSFKMKQTYMQILTKICSSWNKTGGVVEAITGLRDSGRGYSCKEKEREGYNLKCNSFLEKGAHIVLTGWEAFCRKYQRHWRIIKYWKNYCWRLEHCLKMFREDTLGISTTTTGGIGRTRLSSREF